MHKVSYAQLRAFNAVAREGSVSLAAQVLGVSQPAVSAHIRSLEEAFGVQLFVRTGRGTDLTSLGKALYAQSVSLNDIEEAATEILSSSNALKTGDLRVMCGAPNPAMALIAEFCRRYPGIRVTATFGNWDQVASAIFERECDVAILTQAPDDERVIRRRYVAQRIVALVPQKHRLAQRRKSISLCDLAKEPLIFRSDQSLTQNTVNDRFRELGLEIRPSLVLEAREAVYEAAAQDLGIGFMFEFASTRTDGVVRLPIKELPQTFTEDIFCLKPQFRRRAVAALFDLVAEKM
jgi:molybdate transport repressor ModE-like protein